MCKYCDGTLDVIERDCTLTYRTDQYESGKRRIDVPSAFCSNCGTPLGETEPLLQCCKNCAGTIEKNKRGNPVCDIYKQCGTPDFYCAHFREPKVNIE